MDFLKKMIQDIQTELGDEFDKNFQRKGFFNKKWPESKLKNTKGSLMMRSGALRRSISSRVQGNQIRFQSSLPYASIHNEGGEIEVTQKMKSYFWAMYYKASGAITKTKKGAVSKSKRNQRLTNEAEQWKNLALMKVGHKIKIEQRQFIGDDPGVRKAIERVTKNNLNHINDHFKNKVKR
ncbi:phage virion morphogenesis protein [Aquimarina algiphila]|uniref:phage virion morphogenesis protein n=1 Tax=Aquimarina algiphila TaxID=2047982 RepID=UPI00232FDF16|nr:phage virion morphogenesis protein [Aquimarina algiphila]